MSYGNEIIEAINTGDIELTKQKLQVLLQKVSSEPEAINWIVVPENITNLHQLLIQKFEVLPKNMQLRHRVPSKRKRAVLFVRAMINGLERIQQTDAKNEAEKQANTVTKDDTSQNG